MSAAVLFVAKGMYKVGGSSALRVSDSEDEVLQAFLRNEAMTERELIDASGNINAPKVLRRLAKKYSEAFRPAIRLPGAKGRGGYAVSVVREDVQSP